MPRRIGTYQEQPNKIFNQGLFDISSDAKHRIGTVRPLDDGRIFAYAKAGGTELAAGVLTQQIVADSALQNIAVTAAAAIGDKELSVTFTATAGLAANDLANGWLHVNDEAGEGHLYKIRGNTAFAVGVATAGTVYLYDSLRVALTKDTSEITATPSVQWGTVICPTTLTAVPAGVTSRVVTANYYYWNQVKGVCCVLTDGTIAIGEEVAPSNGTAGSVEAMVHATTLDTNVGSCITVNASTEYSLINLNIPGY